MAICNFSLYIWHHLYGRNTRNISFKLSLQPKSYVLHMQIRRRIKQVPLAFYKATPTSLFSDSEFTGWTFGPTENGNNKAGEVNPIGEDLHKSAKKQRTDSSWFKGKYFRSLACQHDWKIIVFCCFVCCLLLNRSFVLPLEACMFNTALNGPTWAHLWLVHPTRSLLPTRSNFWLTFDLYSPLDEISKESNM